MSDKIGENVERDSCTIFLFLETVGREQRAEVVDDGDIPASETCFPSLQSGLVVGVGCLFGGHYRIERINNIQK
jgi:hypothetical protein